MKLNTLFVAAICASTLLNSCVFETAKENQLQITHTSLVDGDAFAVIQHVNETALDGIKFAELAEQSGDSKDAAIKVKGFYTQLLPQLDSIATKFDVTFNPVPAVHGDTAVAHDSIAVADHHGHKHDYLHQAQTDIAFVKEQLKRLTHNTNKDLQIFGKAQLAKAEELYKEIGGKEEAHGHH